MACQIARIVFPLSAFLTLWSRASASDWVRVSVDIWNLSYADITPSGKEGLSWGYASDLATALSVPVADVRDLDGASAHVTLLAEADPSPSSTTSVEQSTTQPATSTSSGAAGNSSAANATTTPLATSSTTREASTTRLPTPAPTSSPNGTGMPPLWPMQGVAYGALPCKGQSCTERGLPSQDMLQIGYEAQWGASGRDDLGVMRALGGNAVRMYHSFGLNTRSDHGGFLNRAQELGVNVMPGFHTEMSHECQEFDCFEAWKNAASKGFQLGYQQGGGWHPAVAMVVLLNEPDFMEFSPQCQQNNPGAWCRVRAALSALDGLLAAEREAGVAAGRVNLTIAWSFGMMHSIDDQVYGPGYFGFQDMKVAVANPQLAGYTPRTPQAEFEEAYRTRWVNCLNTQAPWDFVNSVISGNYEPFKPTPWFIGEYGANGQPRDVIEQDLRDMQRHAASDAAFMGVNFFQFQTANQKGGSEMNFGMFGLSSSNSVSNERIATKTYTAWCLTPMKAKTMGDHCGETKTDVDYVIESNWSRKMDHMPTAALCCDQCHKAEECHAWTWVQDAGLDGCPSQCWLKGAGHVRREPKRGVVSGLLRSDSSKKEPPTYVHDILAGAFGGSGVTMHQLCPTLTTTTTLMPPKPKEPASKPELVVSASWLGCFRRHGGSEPKSLGRRGTKSCARECRRHRYMFLREGGLCRCSDDRPGSPHYKHDDDEECSGDCVGQDGATSKGYCGASSHDAVYSIKVSERASGSPTPAPRLRSLLTVVDG
mmetsp:Transcript_83149/g.252081  ORF Transcript_83149/g.252081 Transcript_83149/m.252081 type:complete len:765 (-) Transcript_83149:15-2309(-)